MPSSSLRQGVTSGLHLQLGSREPGVGVGRRAGSLSREVAGGAVDRNNPLSGLWEGCGEGVSLVCWNFNPDNFQLHPPPSPSQKQNKTKISRCSSGRGAVPADV